MSPNLKRAIFANVAHILGFIAIMCGILSIGGEFIREESNIIWIIFGIMGCCCGYKLLTCGSESWE